MELERSVAFAKPVNLSTLDSRKKNPITVRATSGIETMLAKSGYKDLEYRGQLTLDFSPTIQNVAKKYDKVPVAIGQFQQGKDIISAGVLADSQLLKWGAESMRVIEFYYLCKEGKIGKYDEQARTAYITMKEIFALTGKTEPKQRQRYRKKFLEDLLVAAMPTWYITVNGAPAGADKFLKWDYIPKGDIISMRLADHIQNLFLSSQRFSDTRKLLLTDNLDYAIAQHLESRYTINHNNETNANNIISVKSLLEIADNHLPSKEKAAKHLMKLRGQPIIDALNAAMKAGTLTSWTFCGPKKEPYTQEQIDKCFRNYSDFEKAYVLFECAIGATDDFQTWRNNMIEKHQRHLEIQEKKKRKGKK